MDISDPIVIFLIAVIFLLGGIIKGVIGMGLPVFTVALGTLFMPVTEVFGLSIIPILVTNFWQVRHGKGATEVFKRFWPMIIMMLIGLVVGSELISVLDGDTLLTIIGVVIVVTSIMGLANPHAHISKRAEFPVSLVAGFSSGVSGGLSTIWGPPISMFLMMTDLKKEDYICATGVIWVLAAVPLSVLFYLNGIIHSGNYLYSMALCVPSMIGIGIGQHIRSRFSQDTFRKILLIILLVIGFNLI